MLFILKHYFPSVNNQTYFFKHNKDNFRIPKYFPIVNFSIPNVSFTVKIPQ